MTKKDYELIAGVMSKFPEKHLYKVDLVIDFTKALKVDNSRFDVAKFIAACLGLDAKLDFKDQDAVAAESEGYPGMMSALPF
jgi:hypothetical protein